MDDVKTIAEQAQPLLIAIQESGKEWVKRADIARQLGKSTLNAGELVLLQHLVETGQIEAIQEDTYAPSGRVFKYKAVR